MSFVCLFLLWMIAPFYTLNLNDNTARSSRPRHSSLNSPHCSCTTAASCGQRHIARHRYLFRHRNDIVEYFPPNFHPPYDTPEKRAIITAVLSRQWDEHTLSWKDC